MSDPDLLLEPPLPWEAKAPVLGFWGKMTGWKYSRARSEAWHRQEQMTWFLNQQNRMPVHIYDSPLSFRQCYGVVNRYRFQLQPRSGYFFHSARIVQSALTGTIPIILLHKSYLPLLYEEAPFLKADHNILLGFDGAYDELLDKIQDSDLTSQIHQNLGELLKFGTISSCLEPLISRIFETFGS